MFGFFGDAVGMQKAATQLKNLRKAAVPRLTVRAMAEALDMPLGSYARYESAHDYKKQFLPVDLARKVAKVLSGYGVDPVEVMQLAGLNVDEAQPEAREIEAARPQVYFATLPVALPSENALADMFESLLALIPAEATRAEAARILAQRLPSGFAAIGPVVLDPGTHHGSANATAPRSSATDHPEPEQPSRT
ncbi:helix-turn-helix transcriptional regulator [Sphingobium sp. WCS2017Hpa-17]|uniref:helix-turn-helix domain-containing protein n=1 Tax=Sphingobium sp. WCS2017Hpa-17 TaxID=3073638 RepID=UPI0028898C2E|nr:helix-turn-helix transcriptional regulator [Sphingobium sp. WCS2017Hpa-17]